MGKKKMNREEIKEKYKKINRYVSYGTTIDTDFDIKTNGVNKKDNKAITIKIDADIEEYLNKIEKVTFIESYKNGCPDYMDKTNYINTLIREDMKRTLDLDINAGADETLIKWLEYKKANKLK